MPVRFLSEAQRSQLSGFPADLDGDTLGRFFTFSDADLTEIRRRHGQSNRLGWALQLCALRMLGFCPDDVSTAPAEAISFVARQLTVDPELAIHLILDNGSSHTSKATKAWIEEHTRFTAHYTPVHTSWVNQVELVFSILTRKVLKRGSFGSRDDLVSKIMRYIALRNETAKPFAWTYAAKPLKVAS